MLLEGPAFLGARPCVIRGLCLSVPHDLRYSWGEGEGRVREVRSFQKGLVTRGSDGAYASFLHFEWKARCPPVFSCCKSTRRVALTQSPAAIDIVTQSDDGAAFSAMETTGGTEVDARKRVVPFLRRGYANDGRDKSVRMEEWAPPPLNSRNN